MIHFISDLHLGHARIIDLAKRPFSDVHVMNKTIMANIMKAVSAGDVLYILGDLGFDKDAVRLLLRNLKKQNVNVQIIKGNHDKWPDNIYQREGALIHQQKVVKYSGQSIHLNHYPMACFDKSHANAWHLYGHLHYNSHNILDGKRMNVNCELHDYRPVTLDEVSEFMTTRPDNWDLIPDLDK
jgi:calcineurin-like phosphoesterase family protein